MPFFALHDWRAAFERLGVTIDRDAYEQINLIEQDAAKQKVQCDELYDTFNNSGTEEDTLNYMEIKKG